MLWKAGKTGAAERDILFANICFNHSERYKIIQLYRIFIWINCNFMHTYPLEKAAPNGEIFKRFLYINILMWYALPLYARKFSRITKSVPWKTKIYLTLFVRRSACQSLIFKTALPFYGGKGASAFSDQAKRCLSRERPNRHAASIGIFKKRER